MTARVLLIAALTVTVSTVAAYRLRPEQATTLDAEAIARLTPRLNVYYALLKEQKFEETWTFLSAALRRATPQREYAAMVQKAQRDVEVLRGPTVQFDSGAVATVGGGAPPTKRQGLRARAVADLRITGTDGKVIVVRETTIWAFGPNDNAPDPDWYIIGEETKDVGKAGTM